MMLNHGVCNISRTVCRRSVFRDHRENAGRCLSVKPPRYHALAVDFDGTIAHDRVVDRPTRDALRRARAAGAKLLLITGRLRSSLQRDFDEPELFDLVVLENGAVILDPAADQEEPLSDPPPPEFAEELLRRGVPEQRLRVGRVIVSTWRPHELIVAEVIRDLGLDRQIIFNKDAVMTLPPGLDKEAGLRAALDRLSVATSRAIGVGDAENDEPLLAVCGLGVAVANATAALKEQADLVTHGERGRGVAEVIDRFFTADHPI